MKYAKLINCESPDQVRKAVLEWSSDLSENQHLIKSGILEIHARVEEYIKNILYKILEQTLVIPPDKEKFEKAKKQLQNTVLKMNFTQVYRLLKPGFISFDYPDLLEIPEINNVRNLVVHGDLDKVIYKKRNPFKDHDCLAQIFVEAWAIRKNLDKYYEFVIENPKFELDKLYKFYKNHQK